MVCYPSLGPIGTKFPSAGQVLRAQPLK